MSDKAIYKKIADARKHVKQTPHKKEGWNEYSKYKYFTPEQVEQIVYEACAETGLLTMFSIVSDNNGHPHGELKIIDIETGEYDRAVMYTAMPSIKATNATQQAGGAMTFTERYLKMSAFGIAENSLDFDSQDNRKSENNIYQTYDDYKKRISNCNSLDVLRKIYSEVTHSGLTEVYITELHDLCSVRSDEIKEGAENANG